MAKGKRSSTKEFSFSLTHEDMIDVKLFIEKRNIVKFSLNYRTLVNERWENVYRIDSYHDYVHEQRFWVSNEPIEIPRFASCVGGHEVREWLKYMKNNFIHYKNLFKMKSC